MRILFVCILFSCIITGCRNNPNLKKDQLLSELTKEENTVEPSKKVELPEYYTPPEGVEHQPIYMRSSSFVRLDMQQVLKNERPVKLSDIGKEVIYHRITEPIYNIRNIYAVPGGYVFSAFMGSLYFMDQNFRIQQKLIEEDLKINKVKGQFWIMSHHVISDWCYEKHSGLMYCLVAKNLSDKMEYSTGTISLDELKNSPNPITPDGLKNKIKGSGRMEILPLRNGYFTLKMFSPVLYTFNSKGDTLCMFNPVTDVKLTGSTVRSAELSTRYVYQDYSYFRPAYTDRIFRIKDANTFEEVYQIDFGDKQVSPADGPRPGYNLSDKLLMDNWYESDDYIFIRFTQDYDCPNTRDSGSVKFHQAIYNKKTREFYSFTNHKKMSEPYNIPNDIDNGIDFWPTRMIDDKPYMVLSGEKYKEMLKDKPEHTAVFPDITDDEVVLITIN